MRENLPHAGQADGSVKASSEGTSAFNGVVEGLGYRSPVTIFDSTWNFL
jgi:hypothetical protein